ncbi:MAG: outer membrane lipoprotein chaperone LolA [Proteobacteria bacterium]|nr:outer membrane lipoprotein chaperone LolA [Pseudomonadota bacterium]MCH8176813.1 outer membrane lipoprotein chaperone LolA [Pseudomonadota bacterium]
MKKLVILFLVVSYLSGTAFAQSAESRLNAALKSLDNLTADFKQTVLDEDKQVVQQSSGRVAIQRPGKFSWIYTTPYEQQIIADGSELWVYDVDLDQVTVKPMESGLAAAPIMILMRQQEIGKEFVVSEVGQRKFLYWVRLEPKTKDMDYSQVYIGLKDGVVKAMELRDNFGQSTQIVFENLRLNVVHNPDIFRFIPPEGVDVFGAGG